MISREDSRRIVLVTVLYAVLTFVMAYPFSASPGSTVLGDLPDTHLFIWTLAWDAHAFLHQPVLIFDANIYHPYPNTLAYSENLIGSAFIAAPIIWLTGNLVLAMNLTALVTCVLCGLGAYLLARRWGLTPAASFLCGVIFAFAPPRFVRMGQLHLTAVQWIPFTLAFLHGYFERGYRRDLLLAIGCFSLQVLSSGHGAAFLVVAIVLQIAWRLVFGEPIAFRRRLNDVGVAGLYLLSPALWVLMPYRMAQVDAGLRREYPAEAMPGLTELLASPSRLHMAIEHAIFGRTWNEQASAFLFPGILPIVLATIAIVSWRRRPLRNDATWFFTTLAVVATLMFVTWPVDLWRHVYWLPGFNFIRVPSRFILLVMLCVSVLGAIAFERLTAAYSHRTRLAAAAVASLVLLAEFSSHPFAGAPFTMEIPAIDRWLDTRPKPFAIAEVPIPSVGNLGAHERFHTRSMLHATAHWQKTVHGYSGIRRPLHEDLYAKLTMFPDRASVNALRDAGVNYVVVHTDDYPPGVWRDVESRLAASNELELLRIEGAGRVYFLRPR